MFWIFNPKIVSYYDAKEREHSSITPTTQVKSITIRMILL